MNVITHVRPARRADWFLVSPRTRHVIVSVPRDGELLMIGRDRRSDVCIDDRTVSRTHAHFRVRGLHLELTDDSSRNGTRVNGQPLEPGIPHRLYGGERLHFGDVALSLVDAASWLALT